MFEMGLLLAYDHEDPNDDHVSGLVVELPTHTNNLSSGDHATCSILLSTIEDAAVDHVVPLVLYICELISYCRVTATNIPREDDHAILVQSTPATAFSIVYQRMPFALQNELVLPDDPPGKATKIPMVSDHATHDIP